ncbi:hypothetical protein RJ639_016142 [Escallonia herrerae]|uniref:Reverse transcriptase RNase H-like domain-containing protein n=1 Tax=Escallonia herrerae TaxID=1293975 RepID=A0AA88VDZ2_9ASTE|nr:hypothetical protein RJ639_016142 [Escallonia herrerae]
MASSKERIDALEAQMGNMFKNDHYAPSILKQFPLRLDVLEENLEGTDNARHAKSMDWKSKFQELQNRVELFSWAVVNTLVRGMEHSSRPQVGNPEEDLSGEKPKDTLLNRKGDVLGKGLMYVDIKVNEKAIRAIMDTRIKAINSVAHPVVGIARSVLIKVGPYEGRTNFSIVTMNNFKLILGLEFLRDTNTIMMPYTNTLAMLGSKPYVIPTISHRARERSTSAFQLKKRLKWDKTTYLAMFRWDKVGELSGLLLREVKVILNDFEDAMSEDPVLALPDVSKSFEVHTDASDFALGGVLMQECHPMAYESRTLNEAERHYTTHGKELLAIVYCVRVWRHNLLGSSFVVRTDNIAVRHFLSQSKLTSKQAKRQELLAEFNFMLRV